MVHAACIIAVSSPPPRVRPNARAQADDFLSDSKQRFLHPLQKFSGLLFSAKIGRESLRLVTQVSIKVNSLKCTYFKIPLNSGTIMKATNSINIIPFDPNSSMNVNAWLKSTEDQFNLPQSVTENKCELRKEVKDIIKNFDSVFSKDKYDVGALRVEPQRIVLNSDLPVSLRPYRTSPVEEQEIKSQVEKLLQAGLIKESNSRYSSPVTLSFKRDEGKKIRLCIDFRKLNALCKSDSEPLPLMDSLLNKLSKAKFFSSLDLASGYWRVPIHPKDT
ncbi:Transposon Ty3-I Gag-Pol polyprotein [Araneus ventricosus]|uniref:Transposon Ty3-I Gag-Pol polyprotein n=1 Tax=Araneus ventricosus TaxID=182803 RepID=A0A4Y2UZ06_ARAVE|nr:Transposon Ty3-I Gag-Pol polyprotein [Araneus ventricosus]